MPIGKQRFVIAVALFAGYVVVLYVWGASSPTTSSQVGPHYVTDSTVKAEHGWSAFSIFGAAVVLVAVTMFAWAILNLVRDRGTRFRDLSKAEQDRRREAGRLLRIGDEETPPELHEDRD